MPASSQLTLRDLGPRLRAALEREASRRGLSLNRTALALLAEATGVARGGPTGAIVHHDLDAQAGTWSAQEARRFDAVLARQRTIDPKLWR